MKNTSLSLCAVYVRSTPKAIAVLENRHTDRQQCESACILLVM